MMTPLPHLASSAAFHTTRWTRVSMAKEESEDGQKALADLCDAYYEPVVAYLRQTLRDADTAREMSHAFFAEILGGGCISTADPDRGRFRSYLLGAVKHFLSRQRESAQRLKRGGAHETVALDAENALHLTDEPSASPDSEFDRQWAITVITRSMNALRAQCTAEGKGAFFDSISGILSGHASHGDMVALASTHGITFDAFRMAVSRLRKRLRQCVKDEVAGTLREPAVVEEEMQSLFAALSR